MALPSGAAATAGCKVESTYGVAVTPDRFWPLVSESIDVSVARVESNGIVAGYTVLGTDEYIPGSVAVAGDLGFELYDRSCGLLFSQMFGGVSTTGSGTYTHTFTPSSTTPSGYTWQIGRPDVGGTVNPVTVTGTKVQSWELAGKEDEAVTIGLSVVAQNLTQGSRTAADGVTTNASTTVTSAANAAFTQEDVGKVISSGTTAIPANATIVSVNSATSVTISAACTASTTGNTLTIGKALASASYASSRSLMGFHHGGLTIGSQLGNVIEWSIKGENALTDRRPRAGYTTTGEPLIADRRTYTTTIKAEFASTASYNAFRAGTEAALSLPLVHPISGNSATISGNVRLDKATTNVSGRGLLEVDIEAKFVRTPAGADSTAISAVLVNGDSAA